jgi:hypothetical protein
MSLPPAADPQPRAEIGLRRSASVPPLAYPPELPVSAHRDEIRDAIRACPVVIVCGETGSGKTTQLHAKWRSAIRPAKPARRPTADRTPAERYKAMTWSQCLARVFKIDGTRCEYCGARCRSSRA